VRKLEALRALLMQTVPGLATKPENLSVYASKGRIGAVSGATMSFEYRYTATLMVQDFAGDPDLIFVPLVAWATENQTEITRQANGDAFGFEMDLLDTNAMDIEVSIELTERVIVNREGGNWKVTHKIDAAMSDRFPGIPADTSVARLIVKDLVSGMQLVIPDTAQ